MQFVDTVSDSSAPLLNCVDIRCGLSHMTIHRKFQSPLYSVMPHGRNETKCKRTKVKVVLLPVVISTDTLADCAVLLGKTQVSVHLRKCVPQTPELREFEQWKVHNPIESFQRGDLPATNKTLWVYAAMEFVEKLLGIWEEPPAPNPLPRAWAPQLPSLHMVRQQAKQRRKCRAIAQ